MSESTMKEKDILNEIIDTLEIARDYVSDTLGLRKQSHHGYEVYGDVDEIGSHLNQIDNLITKLKGGTNEEM